MKHRFEDITAAHTKTFDWLFNLDSQGSKKSEFVFWLQYEHGIYWINGKAGSGKSTLMKYILDNPQTTQILQSWSGCARLTCAHHFFSESGTKMQKSHIGLLRALIHQILAAQRPWIHFLFPKQRDEHEKQKRQKLRTFWAPEKLSDAEVTEAFKLLLKCPTEKHRLCFFIDGLDEYEGPDREIAEIMTMIGDWHSQPASRIKLCISSRPHSAFQKAFYLLPSLRLQDLTREDISSFVFDKLKPDKYYLSTLEEDDRRKFTEIVKNVVNQASGVFLWVKLAVVSLLDGLEYYDRIPELQARVNELPPDLEDFYLRMLKRINCRYQIQAVRLFQAVVQNHETLDLLGFSFVEGDELEITRHPIEYFTVDRMRYRFTQTKAQVESRYACLFEIQEETLGSTYYRTRSRVTLCHKTLRDYLKTPEACRILSSSSPVSSFNMDIFNCVSSLLTFKCRIRNGLSLTDVDVDEEMCFFSREATSAIRSLSFLSHPTLNILMDEFAKTSAKACQDILSKEYNNNFGEYFFRADCSDVLARALRDNFMAFAVLQGWLFWIKGHINDAHYSINGRTALGLPLLFWAVSPILDGCPVETNLELIGLLLQSGLDVNARPRNSFNPLFPRVAFDVRNDNFRQVVGLWAAHSPWEALLLSFATSPFHWDYWEPTVKLFVSYGASLDLLGEPLDEYGSSTLDLLLEDPNAYGGTLQLLMQHGLKLSLDQLRALETYDPRKHNSPRYPLGNDE